MAKQTSDFVISSLKGGMNDQDPSHSLPEDQCVLAENVEFFSSMLGERRRGTEAIDLTGSNLDSEEDMVFLSTHMPKGAEVFETELWAASATLGTSATLAHRDKNLVWTEIVPADAINPSATAVLYIQGQTLHGKMFLAYLSDKDRLHVFDGTTFRPAGLAAPVLAPTVVDTANPGAFVDDRIYRVRFIEMSGTKILRRSEPSPEVTFTPVGTFDGAIITEPALVNEGETHWELEASDGDGNFYVISTLPIATTTFTDTTQPATDYANIGVLSEDIGSYTLIPSVKYVKKDQDRLIVGSNWTDGEKNCRVAWTPVWSDPGVGNDERIPETTDNFIDLDWGQGGELTGLSDPVNGVFYAFKWTSIYKFQRTGRFDKAYDSFLISGYRGAIKNSIVAGVDEFGKGCIYFLDPSIGPMRIGSQGLQHIQNIRGTWRQVNSHASLIVTHGTYYPDKLQVHWWISVNGSNTPNKKIILQVNEIRSTADGTERGWVTATGLSTEAWCSTTFPEFVDDEATSSPMLSFRPYIGLSNPVAIHRTDVGSTDGDTGFRGRIVTKAYLLVGLLNRWGAMTAALLASPNSDPDTRINVIFIRDFGKEENPTTTNFHQDAHETLIIKVFDNLVMSDSKAIQVEFSDPV